MTTLLQSSDHVAQTRHSTPHQIETTEESFAVWEIEGHSLVVVPSISFSAIELRMIECILCYEERILFVLFALAHPNTKLFILTSTKLEEWVIRYHLSLLPLERRESAARRVRFYSLEDPATDRSLAEKLCVDTRGIENIQKYCKEANMTTTDPQQIYLMIWRATAFEDKLSELLGLPFHCATQEQSLFGTKPGSRSIFRHLNIPCADGTYKEEKDLDEFCRSIWKVLHRNPRATKGVIKLTDGFAGVGNAVLDLTRVQERLQTVYSNLIDFQLDKDLHRLTMLAFQEATYYHRTWENYREELTVMGCIFELFLGIDDALDASDQRFITSPSVQGVIDENGSVSMLSTHEQLLDQQVYLGCEFPCKSDYRLQLLDYGSKIGNFLANVGVRDRFGVDFLCVPKPKGEWKIWAVEINIRMTGTTHPWYVQTVSEDFSICVSIQQSTNSSISLSNRMTMKLLTHGHIDPATGLFLAPNGKPKYYVSSDNISAREMKNSLYPETLFHLMRARPDLHWNPSQQVGVILHMIARVSKTGTLSMTAVADSLEDAHRLFDKTRRYLANAALFCV